MRWTTYYKKILVLPFKQISSYTILPFECLLRNFECWKINQQDREIYDLVSTMDKKEIVSKSHFLQKNSFQGHLIWSHLA